MIKENHKMIREIRKKLEVLMFIRENSNIFDCGDIVRIELPTFYLNKNKPNKKIKKLKEVLENDGSENNERCNEILSNAI